MADKPLNSQLKFCPNPKFPVADKDLQLLDLFLQEVLLSLKKYLKSHFVEYRICVANYRYLTGNFESWLLCLQELNQKKTPCNEAPIEVVDEASVIEKAKNEDPPSKTIVEAKLNWTELNCIMAIIFDQILFANKLPHLAQRRDP